MLKDSERAKDVVQEVNLKLWKIRHTLNTYQSIEGLSMRMTKNLCLNALKSKHRKLTDLKGNLPDMRHDLTPFQVTAQRDELAQVRDLMNVLSEKQRTVFHLRHFEHQTFEEIAATTGWSVNNIQVLLSRARKKLITHFEKRQNYGI
jgi:RNA polymerase sigma-70 factor (ECF subfamily)